MPDEQRELGLHHGGKTHCVDGVPSPRHNYLNQNSGLTDMFLRFCDTDTNTYGAEQVRAVRAPDHWFRECWVAICVCNSMLL
jgi:hypothetical protein